MMLLLFEKRKQKKYAGVKVFICLLVATVVLMAPYILHYNYSALAIWCSPCLLIAIAGIEVCLAEYIILCIGNRKKYVVE